MMIGKRAMSDNSANRADNGGTPIGVNHIVLNVRDIEEAHRFWTEIIGLKQVGELHPRTDMGPGPVAKMRFYSGDHGGKITHHDVAIVENPNLPPSPANWGLPRQACTPAGRVTLVTIVRARTRESASLAHDVQPRAT
jgi:hypothetical protein